MDTTTTSTEIEAELIELYNLVEEKEKEIAKLKQDVAHAKTASKDVSSSKNKTRSLSRSSSNKDKRLKQCRAQLSECKDAIVDLEARLQQSHVDQKALLDQKVELTQTIETLQSKLSHQSDALQSTSKARKDQSNDQYRLEVENEKLRNAVTELEKNEEDLIAEVEQLTEERDSLSKRCTALADDRDRLGLEFDRYVQGRSNDKGERADIEKRLQEAIDENADLREEVRLSQEAYGCEISSLQADLDKARRDSIAIEEQAAMSYNAQKQRALENEIGNLRDEVRRVREDLKRCAEDKDQAERDLEKTCKALADAGKECEQRVHEALVKERIHAQELETRLDAASSREQEMETARLELKRQKDEVALQLCRSDERNAWYEEGHGLADAVRYQKKLEADMFRRDHDLEQLQMRHEEEIGRCKVLQKLVSMLKEKYDLAEEPALEEDAVKEAMAAHDNQLEAQNAELGRQIECLEADRLAMMKQLRHNAAEIGEKGIKFLGLDAAQIEKVMEFASNIRDGSVTLPMDDRSKELMAELTAIKAEQKTDKVTIERLERDLIGLRGCDATHIKIATEVESLRQSLDEAQIENGSLQDEISVLKENAAKMHLAHEAATKDVLPPVIRERASEILGEPLVELSSAGQVQVLCLIKKYDEVSEGLSRIQEATKAKKADPSHHGTASSEHKTPSTDTALHLQILEQKMSICNIASDSPLYKEVRTMASELAGCTAKLAAKEQELVTKDGLLQQHASEIKTMREQVATIYQDHVRAQKQEIPLVVTNNASKKKNREMDGEPQRALHPAASPPVTDPALLVNALSHSEDGVEQLQALQKELTSVRESAQSRMAQLKTLLDEKNATIERYRQKLLSSGAIVSSPQPVALPQGPAWPNDSSSHSTLSGESETTVAKLRRAVTNANLDCESKAGNEARISLVKQVDALANLVKDKETRIHALETNLREAQDGRTASEKRCSDALHEMDRIKGDMQSLAHLIKDSEGRMLEASAASRQVTSLQCQLEEKEDAVQRLGSQLSRLKAKYGAGTDGKGGSSSFEQHLIDEAKISQLTADLSKVKRQLTSTRLAKRKCEEELEHAKKQSAGAVEDVQRMEQEVTKYKQAAIDARTDKENASSRAARAVTKLREIQNADEIQKRELERIQELEKKVASLLRKNAGLRGQLASAKGDCSTGPNVGTGTPDDHQGDQAKKMKTLEKRLEERRIECKKLRDDLDAMRKTRQKDRAIVSELRSSIKNLEDENAKLKGDIAGSANSTRNIKQEEQIQNELKRLQEEVVELKSKNPGEGGPSCQVSSACALAPDTCISYDRLRDDLERAEKEKQSLADKLRTTSLAEQRLQSRIVNLESEKAMLQNELKAFDLDFFEEIEDLKFKYSEVCKQLKKHKTSSGGTSKEGGCIEEDDGGLGPWSSLIY